MSRLIAVALSILVVAMPALAIDTQEGFEDPALDARYRSLIHEIRCMKCQNQSIADSPIDVAADLRRQVREMIAEGSSDAEIKTYLSSRYGDFILYRPPVKPTTWALWAGPAVLLLAGAALFARLIRGYSRLAVDDDAEDGAA